MSGAGRLAAEAAALRAWKREADNPLRREMGAAVTRITQAQTNKLRVFGYPVPALLAAGLLGVVRAETDRNGFWQPCAGGKWMIVVPAIEDEAMIDLIAFDPGRPERWFQRVGDGDVLGADALQYATRGWSAADRCAVLHATPADWLQAGATGVCVVRWTWEARANLSELDRIDVGDVTIARQLRLELSRPARLPRIEVVGARRHVA